MFFVIKALCVTSVANLGLILGAFIYEETLFDGESEGITWLHILGNIIAFLEIMTLYGLTQSKIEDC